MPSRSKPLRAAIYARISVSTERSVSIDRQIEAAREFAERKGWAVVSEFIDDGVSASKNRPEDRKGWRALTAAAGDWDVVVVWKMDRLVRNMRDFWRAHEWLTVNDKAMAFVEGDLDMTTSTGQVIATVQAFAGQSEAEAISARIKGARSHLLKQGRVVGGAVPYGWRSIPNPDGPGYVLRHDEERIDVVRGMVERCQRGDTLYSIKRWLEDSAAPLPKASQQNRKNGNMEWRYSTIERLLRHPVLAGATLFNPGNASKQRGTEVLRDELGLPVIDPAVALVPYETWQAIVARLDNRDSPQSKPRAMRSKTSALLSGLVFCTDGKDKHTEPVRMYRSTTQGREGYSCPTCAQTLSNFEDELIEHFLEMKGDWVRWRKIEKVHDAGGAVGLPAVEQTIREVSAALAATDDDAEEARLQEQMRSLKDERRRLKAQPGRLVDVWEPSDHYFSELWAMAGDDVVEQRAVLNDAIERVLVKRGSPGRRKAGDALKRLEIIWKRPAELGPRPLG